MRKLFYFLLAAVSLTLAACSSMEEKPILSGESNQLVLVGKQFAGIHNDCLDSIYANLSLDNISTRNGSAVSQDNIEKQIIDYANSYIATILSSHSRSVSTNASYVSIEEFDTITIDSIKSHLTSKELLYIDKYTEDEVDKEEVLNTVASDVEIPKDHRLALICFMTTFDASRNYWEANYKDWLSLFGKTTVSTRSHFRFNLKEVIFADAWWAYQGLLSSGMNPYVGGGAAAVGSAFTCLK